MVKKEEMERIFDELTEENKDIMLMVANAIKLGQASPVTYVSNSNNEK